MLGRRKGVLPLLVLPCRIARVARGFLFGGEGDQAVGFLAAQTQAFFLGELVGFGLGGGIGGLAFGSEPRLLGLLRGTLGDARFALLGQLLALGLALGELRIVRRRLGAGPFELRLLGLGGYFQPVLKSLFLKSAHAVLSRP